MLLIFISTSGLQALWIIHFLCLVNHQYWLFNIKFFGYSLMISLQILKNFTSRTRPYPPKYSIYLCRSRYCTPLLILKYYKNLMQCRFFFSTSFGAHILVLGDCVRTTIMVQLTIHHCADPLSDFSNCQLILWPLITWPCPPYTVSSQLNADIYKIRFRKWSLRCIKERAQRLGEDFIKSKIC